MQGPIAKGLGTALYGPILAFTEQANVRYWPIAAPRDRPLWVESSPSRVAADDP